MPSNEVAAVTKAEENRSCSWSWNVANLLINEAELSSRVHTVVAVLAWASTDWTQPLPFSHRAGEPKGRERA